MAMVVTQLCNGCKHTDCVVVCPVDAFREGSTMLFIDPEECVCCTACVNECPEEAIFDEEDVPPQFVNDIELNREIASVLPMITQRKSYSEKGGD